MPCQMPPSDREVRENNYHRELERYIQDAETKSKNRDQWVYKSLCKALDVVKKNNLLDKLPKDIQAWSREHDAHDFYREHLEEISTKVSPSTEEVKELLKLVNKDLVRIQGVINGEKDLVNSYNLLRSVKIKLEVIALEK